MMYNFFVLSFISPKQLSAVEKIMKTTVNWLETLWNFFCFRIFKRCRRRRSRRGPENAVASDDGKDLQAQTDGNVRGRNIRHYCDNQWQREEGMWGFFFSDFFFCFSYMFHLSDKPKCPRTRYPTSPPPPVAEGRRYVEQKYILF